MVDVVDEKMNILYQTSKKEAHEKGLLHKVVICEIINSKGEIMLIRPYSHKQDAGQYVSPVGGHVTAGEKDEEALKREVAEEIGISDFSFKLIGKAIFNREVLGRKENHFFIVYEGYTDKLPVLGDEAQSYKYFSKEELKSSLKAKPADFGDAYYFVLNNFYPEFLDH